MVNPKLKFHRFSHVNGGAGVIPTVPVLCTMCPNKIPRITGDKTSQFTGYKPTAACAKEAAGQEATVGHLAEHWQLMLQFHYNWTAESSKKPGRHHVSSAHTVFFSFLAASALLSDCGDGCVGRKMSTEPSGG